MPNNVEYVLRARDEATTVVSNVLRQFEGIEGMLSRVSAIGSGAGKFGLVAGALAATASAAISAAGAMADAVEQLDRLEQNTGVSSERLQAMRAIVEENGGSFDEFESVLARVNRLIGDGSPQLKRLGITSRDTFTVFTQVAGILASISDPAAQAKLSYDLLGKSGVKLTADMVALATQTEKTREAMRQQGGLIDPAAAERARDLDKQLDALSRTWKALATSFQSLVVPLVTPVVGFFNAVLSGALAAAKAISEQFTSALRDLAEVSERLPDGPPVKSDDRQRSHVGRLINGQFVAPMLDEYGIEVAASRSVTRAVEGRSRKIKAPSLEEYSLARDRRMLGIFNQLEGTDLSLEEVQNADKALKKVASTLQEVSVPALQFGEAGERAKNALAALSEAANNMSSTVAADISQAIGAFTHGSGSIRVIWQQLMASLAQDLAESFLRLGVGLGLSLLEDVIPGGEFLAGVGKKLTGTNSLAPAGGDTYYISTLNAKDLVQELVSPSGQLRQANDRIRDVAIAASM